MRAKLGTIVVRRDAAAAAPTRARRLVAALLAAAAVTTSCTVTGPDARERAQAAATEFLEAWAAGDHGRAGARTDDAAAATALLDEVKDRLGVIGVKTSPPRVTVGKDETSATAAYDVTLSLATLGSWTYSSSAPLVPTGAGSRWVVDWAPKVVHPELTPETRVGRIRRLPERAPILDRDGRPVMEERPVVEIGIEPRRLTQPARAYRALGKYDVDAARLAARVKAARPDEYVPVVTVRQEQFTTAEPRLRAIPGLMFRESTMTLGPTPTFGRALLGTVRPATEETLGAAGPLASAVDQVGASGLQLAFQRRLAGEPGGEIRLIDRQSDEQVQLLHTFPGKPGRPLRTTLDDETQAAAERALEAVQTPAALVAVQPSTGEVLAAANTPADGLNRAFAGRYPPGSTFKTVTTAALVTHGMDVDKVVPCPATVTVHGKKFKNYDALGALGRVPYRRDYAMSCNTALITAGATLPDEAIAETAASLGMGAQWDLGVPAFSGSVPEPADPVEKAATAIGQGKVLASPLAMAMVTAAVADGTARHPVLLPEEAAGPGAAAGTAVPAKVSSTLRSLLRETVSNGTASVLKMPGEPVGAKTGTAEYGEEVPPRTHAWMAGYRGDMAFAVIVENGESGSKTAGPVLREFLESTARR
ncbi:MAG: penicillin-binding transpeptidase domain-containing protein [Actinomycetota bacterium]|nr:penicillin-binding transpeptidase domain-containing protein [Actinomycetota bacterium]